jgi:hypothetical protein
MLEPTKNLLYRTIDSLQTRLSFVFPMSLSAPLCVTIFHDQESSPEIRVGVHIEMAVYCVSLCFEGTSTVEVEFTD